VPGVPLAAVLHAGDQTGDALISSVAGKLKSQGYAVGGVVQSNPMRPGQSRCDMVLKELTSGQEVPISQDLGNHSRGCRLNSSALEQVVGLVEASVRAGLDVLVLNKFGKQEADGKGLRHAIAMAVDAGIPVLGGLNRANVAAWNDFCGGEGQLLDASMADVEQWLKTAVPSPRRSRQPSAPSRDIAV